MPAGLCSPLPRSSSAEYEAIGAHDKQAAALEKVLAGTTDEHERRALFTRLAIVHREHQRNDARAAFEVLLRAVSELASDLDPWDRLAELGAKTGDQRQVADAYEGALPGPHKLDARRRARAVRAREHPLRGQALRSRRGHSVPRQDPRDRSGRRARVQPPQADPHRPRALGRPAEDVRSRRRLGERSHATGRPPLRDGPRGRGHPRRPGARRRGLRARAPDRPGERARDPRARQDLRARELAAPIWPRLLAGRLDRRAVDDRRPAHHHREPARAAVPREARRARPRRCATPPPPRSRDRPRRRARHRPHGHGAPPIRRAKGTRVRAAEVLERVYLARDEARELDEVTAIRLGESRPSARKSASSSSGVSPSCATSVWPTTRGARRARAVGAARSVRRRGPQHAALGGPSRQRARPRVAEVLGAAADVAEKEGDDVLDRRDPRRASQPSTRTSSPTTARPRRSTAASSGSRTRAASPRRPSVGRPSRPSSASTPRARSTSRSPRSSPSRSSTRTTRTHSARAPRPPRRPPREALLDRRRRDRRLAQVASRWTTADPEALEALDRLYSATDQYKLLVEVLRTRERLTDDPDLRRTLLKRSAEALASKLDDVGGGDRRLPHPARRLRSRPRDPRGARRALRQVRRSTATSPRRSRSSSTSPTEPPTA